MEPDGRFYNLYHYVSKFKKVLVKEGYKVKNEISREDITSSNNPLSLGEIFGNRILVLYDYKNMNKKTQGDVLKLKGIIEEFEVR